MSKLTFEVTERDFGAQVLESALPVLIEFTAAWCPPCKMLAPIVHEMARQYEGRMRVGFVDSDANPALIEQYDVMGLPTLMLFVGGQPLERILGFTPRARIEAKCLPHLAVPQTGAK